MEANCHKVSSSYNQFLGTAVGPDVRLPQIPMGAREILTFFPNHTQWFDVMKRLMRNHFSTEEIARAQLHARGTLTKDNRDRRDQALRHQVSTGGKTAYADDDWTKKRWEASSHPDSRPYTEAFITSTAPFTNIYDVTGLRPNDPTRRVASAPALRDVIQSVVNWPTGEDAGPLTQALLWARRQGQTYLATHTLDDIPAIITTQGFTYPTDATNSRAWDARARKRLNQTVPKPA
ncbi:uncharacterized protein MYCFIDRAFT_82430 [Pseudocercospora fijiensis CIRAD86]|uniref:Uncharacterized protein n=1 Tax=Pseudocercospora fijiensis (strain CIRAD86) TaxID=383855 RepID=M3AMP5_PSEFD|nr:uncharacterized protein MYCFIDRAFT_82430 [Pseudocercospora fijiensis CIRAD86]EME85851.1 hypothetical protein MYCFIDRAFT_82430 [Pseudocercospora fijiensis CIRAD86]